MINLLSNAIKYSPGEKKGNCSDKEDGKRIDHKSSGLWYWSAEGSKRRSSNDFIEQRIWRFIFHDFQVEAISRWESIADRLQSFASDLILLDITLVGVDGRQICKKLKQSENTAHIPVILFSANSEMGNCYREYKAEDFIAKPFEMSHLVNTIKGHLN